MTAPKLGYLCLSENPSREAGRALVRQFVLVREADRMGYDDIWLAEHHLDAAWPQAGMAALLGHLAATTSKARIGSLALLPALHPPLALAETVATLDLLSKGRFALGVASGAAFGPLREAFGLDRAQLRGRFRRRLLDALALLGGAPVPAGEDGADGGAAATGWPLVPLPGQQPVPVWMAADDEASLQLAARHGWGLVAAATHTAARVQRMRAVYMAASGGAAPPLVLARFACSADSADQAEAIARPYLQDFAQRAKDMGWGTDPARSAAQDVQALLAQSLVGRHADVAQALAALADTHGATHVAIVPTAGAFDAHKHILAAFVDEVRPLLEG